MSGQMKCEQLVDAPGKVYVEEIIGEPMWAVDHDRDHATVVAVAFRSEGQDKVLVMPVDVAEALRSGLAR